MSPGSLVKTLFGLVAVDTRPLRESPDYRWLLSAQAISSLGSAITVIGALLPRFMAYDARKRIPS